MSGLRLGVVVPCRNEAAVIERKLADLGNAAWPRGVPRVVVVDDGSTDGTAKRAAACSARGLRVLPNRFEPGKSGAVRTGTEALAGEVDIVVLTDADVLLAPGALLALARAFEEDRRLALACGAQEFVRDFQTYTPTRHPFDFITALVRRVESRFGKLFSVHGQLLAWRVASELVPTPGRPADDLDLMFTARRAGGRVRLIADAGFFEQKLDSEDQAVRRARAYFEALRGRAHPLGDGWIDRLQWRFYRDVPALVPELLLPFAGVLRGLPGGARLVRLLGVIRRARLAEALTPLTDRWEMQRP